jgi:hypothetical protein
MEINQDPGSQREIGKLFSCKNLISIRTQSNKIIGDFFDNRQSEPNMFLSIMTASIYWRIRLDLGPSGRGVILL